MVKVKERRITIFGHQTIVTYNFLLVEQQRFNNDKWNESASKTASERATEFWLGCSISGHRICSYYSLVLSLSSLNFANVPFPGLHPTFFHRLSPVQKEIRTWRSLFHKQPSFLISFSQIPEFLHVSNISSLNNKSSSFSQIILNILHLPISQHCSLAF